MEKKLENEMEAGFVEGLAAVVVSRLQGNLETYQ